jgi:hypothetical protein
VQHRNLQHADEIRKQKGLAERLAIERESQLRQKARASHDNRFAGLQSAREYVDSALHRLHGFSQWAMQQVDGLWGPQRPHHETYTYYEAGYRLQALPTR